MPPNQVARLLADEARAAKDAEQVLQAAAREALRDPVLEKQPLGDDHYRALLELFTGDALQHLARIAWRALSTRTRSAAAYALSAIDLGVETLDAPAKAKAPQRKPQLPADVQELRKQLEEAGKAAERAEKERDSLRDQLAHSARGHRRAAKDAGGSARGARAGAGRLDPRLRRGGPAHRRGRGQGALGCAQAGRREPLA